MVFAVIDQLKGQKGPNVHFSVVFICLFKRFISSHKEGRYNYYLRYFSVTKNRVFSPMIVVLGWIKLDRFFPIFCERNITYLSRPCLIQCFLMTEPSVPKKSKSG